MTPAADTIAGERPGVLWFGFGAMCLGMFMAILDIQIVINSLAVIDEALEIGADRMSWVQTAYLIAEVIAIPLTGLLTRVFSMRWLFCGAIAVFTLASIGCAVSWNFESLIFWRIVQGFAGGVLIPLVFSAVFILFRKGFEQTVATTVAGVLAVLAPAIGPISGGLLTEHFSWHWLFLINVVPGIVAMAIGTLFLRREDMNLSLIRLLDWPSLFAIALGLAALEIGLKEAPTYGWLSPLVIGLFVLFLLCAVFAIKRPRAVVEFRLLKDRFLAYGCGVSFLLGIGLFGSAYLIPVFLAFVRHHGPINIGIIILVTGITQLITAPIAVYLDRKFDARWLSILGFGCFAIGLAMSANQTVMTDYDEMFWPQVVRGAVMALCILPATRFALGHLPLDQVGDASGLYNLSRNLGGAIGIALIDTVMFSRSPDYADQLTELMKTDPEAASRLLGLDVTDIPSEDDAVGLMSIMDSIQEASLTMAMNDAWIMIAALTGIAVLLLLWMGPIRNHPANLVAQSRTER